MNLEIKKLTNGWLLIVSTPQGAMATYYPNDKILAAVTDLLTSGNTPSPVKRG